MTPATHLLGSQLGSQAGPEDDGDKDEAILRESLRASGPWVAQRPSAISTLWSKVASRVLDTPLGAALCAAWSGVAESYEMLADCICDVMDDCTGASEVVQMLSEENERLAIQLAESQAALAAQTALNHDLAAVAETYRKSAAKAHLISARYSRHDRCDHLARACFQKNVTTPQGHLPSTSFN